MEEAPTPSLPFPEEEKNKLISENFKINQENNIIDLNIKIEKEEMIFTIIEKDPIMRKYSRKMTLKEIQSLHQMFSLIKTCSEFLDYLQALSSHKEIVIKKSEDNNLSINFEAEYLFMYTAFI
jgi:hypothetical protein